MLFDYTYSRYLSFKNSMQIKWIKISNLLSFPFYPNEKETPEISFLTWEKSLINILIGPNGAGKSNFLNILNQILLVGLTKDYVYDKSIIKEQHTEKYKEAIICNELLLKWLEKHFNHTKEEARVYVKITLNEDDEKNLKTIYSYRNELNKIITNYSNDHMQITDIPYETIEKITTLVIPFIIDTETKTIHVEKEKLTEEENLIIEYIRHKELFQICIDIYNDTKTAEEERISYLKNTFAFIGLHRNFFNTNLKVNPHIRNEYISNRNSHLYYSFIGYYLCVHKLRHIISKNKKHAIVTQEEIKEILHNNKFYQNLAKVINLYIGKDLDIQYEEPKVELVLKDGHGQIYAFDQLSLWEQSFLIIILTMYWYDLKNGLMLIDEPEIHFHPQMQKKLTDFLNHINDKIKIQCMLSTYSPIFINEENIYNVYRFTKKNLVTTIKNPAYSLRETEADLIHILKFWNTAKIFFVDKIIMVEWETDAYFFEYYINYLKENIPWWHQIGNYEIVNINGKGWFRQRRNFLTKFWLETYFIGDWDNIVENWIINETEMNFYRKASRKFSIKNNIGRYYTRLVEAIRNIYPNKYQYITKKIQELHTNNVFILSHWDLETYMGTYTKWLDDTVKFCHNSFKDWLKDTYFDKHRKELNTIFWKIFGLTTKMQEENNQPIAQ